MKRVAALLIGLLSVLLILIYVPAPVAAQEGAIRFEFESRSADVGSNQAVAYDGTNYFTTHIKPPSPGLVYPWINKLDNDFNIILQRDASTDGPPEFNEESGGIHPQLNGIWAHSDGRIYVSAMNWPNATRLAWVFVYEKSDLSFVEYFDLPGGWSEGIILDEAETYWWVHYYGDPRLERLDLNFAFNVTFDLPSWALGGDNLTGYDGARWYNGRFYGNVHEGNLTAPSIHEYSFDGSSFAAITRLSPPTPQSTQGFDIYGGKAYFAERNFGGGNDNRIVTATIVELFPPEYGVALGSDGTATTDHIVDIPEPPVPEIPENNILVVMLAWGSDTTCSAPSSWTLLVGASSGFFCHALKAQSNATEPASLIFVSGASVRSSWISYRVFADTLVETGTQDTDNPPFLNITSPAAERVGSAADGVRNALWVVINFANEPTVDPRCAAGAAPTDYGNLQQTQTGIDTGHTAFCTANRELIEDVQDPSAWSLTGGSTNRRSATWAFWWESTPPSIPPPPPIPSLSPFPIYEYGTLLLFTSVLILTLAGAWALKKRGGIGL